LSQIGVALNAYASDNQNLYPKATGDVPYAPEESDPATWPWQQQIGTYVGNTKSVFKSPNLPDVDYGYYLGCRAALIETGAFGPVNRLKIRELSKQILGGECIYWAGSKTDADKDDYTQTPSFKQDGSKGKSTPILFADGHVQYFDQFDPNNMSARYEGTGAGNTYPWSP
jgi:prepilin-type processing-associated H-X9-DG protein